MTVIRHMLLSASFASVLLLSGASLAATPAKSTADSASDSAGTIHVPKNYHATYEYLGTWSVAGQKPGADQLHAVFVSPGAVAGYKKDGKFPDGTVLVKEVYEAATEPMTTGAAVSHEKALKGWFVMIKDSKDSHPKNALWGDGWGWSWFDAGDSMKTTSTNYHTDCQGCHVPAKDQDWIYVRGYPVLNK